jgi:LysM repeat protein
VLEHEVAGGDTLQMLAVRHGVSVPCLKRLNNLMSDHALHSRRQLFIPGAARSGHTPLVATHNAARLAAGAHHHHYCLRACAPVCAPLCVLSAAVASQEQLVGRLVRFHFCATIKRDFAVLLPAARRASLDAREQLRADVLERQHHGAAHEPAPRPAARAGRAKVGLCCARHACMAWPGALRPYECPV